MDFDKVVPEWKAQGAEPPESLKTSGFTAGYKPPADYFNWFWYRVSQCLSELHTKLANISDVADAEKSVKYASTAGTANKTKGTITVRLNGGNTEGTDMFTFDGSAGKSVNITPAKIGAADKSAAGTAVSAHNTSTNAHNDIRIEIGKKAPVPIIGTAPPTTSTVGVVGQEYIDKTNKRVWYCTAAESTGYTWILTSAGLSTKVNTTLSASGWSTEKKYTVSNANITATSAVELLPRENNGITQAQMEALSGAMIVGGAQAAGSIQLVALGDKPTTDSPVTLIIRRDL